MTTIKLHNTKTRKREEFVPIDPENVRMYVCGPTVYDRAHLGNARPVIVFDVLYRLLRHVYGPDHVTYVRNFTDVDDKINARAAESGRSIAEITAETTQWFLDDMAAVGALEPNEMPRATAYIPQMVKMIEGLIASGHAYAAEGHVLFAVESYKEYGALSGRSIDDMIAGARVEVAPYKRNPMDFVLWKPSDDATPGWGSPWGRGRPGWHIECSAMADELLWKKPLSEDRLSDEAKKHPHVFDIHGGGLDLQFPHHEDEIAQSCCANGTDEMARYWLHNEMLQVEGKKMSKSLGNFFTVRDLLEQGVPGEVIRFVMLSTHYRKPMDWTEKKAKMARAKLARWRVATENVSLGSVSDEFVNLLTDDLNTPLALRHLDELATQNRWAELKSAARLIGLLTPKLKAWDWKPKNMASTKRLIRREIGSLSSKNLDYFAGLEKFNMLMKSHGLLIETASKASPFAQTELYKEFKYRDLELLKLLRSFSLEEYESLVDSAKEWRRIGTRYPNVIKTAHESVPASLEVFKMAVSARVDLLANKQSIARKNRNYSAADLIRDNAKHCGFELVNSEVGIKWKLLL